MNSSLNSFVKKNLVYLTIVCAMLAFSASCSAQTIKVTEPATNARAANCNQSDIGKVKIPTAGSEVSELFKAVLRQDVKAVKKLLKEKADPNEKDSFGNTPLLFIVAPRIREPNKKPIERVRAGLEKERKSQLLIARELLISGADANEKNLDGRTALIIVAMRGFPENAVRLMNMLIQHKAGVDVQDNDGYTALMRAAENGNTETVGFLLASGARTDMANCEGKTVLAIAESLNKLNVIKILRSAKQN